MTLGCKPEPAQENSIRKGQEIQWYLEAVEI
jgi:hypothetical protein